MVYKNMDELNDCYAIPREEMSFVKELLYIEDCFDTYEILGFCETYKNCYNGNDGRNGMSFKINRRVTTDEVDQQNTVLEVGIKQETILIFMIMLLYIVEKSRITVIKI